MDITGKIIVALEPLSGTSRAGNAWKKREYVLETQETYPKKVFFNFFGDRVDQYPLNVGDMVKISFDINSREFNGRWYTDISAWKAEPANNGGAQEHTVAEMPGGYDTPTVPPAVDLGSSDPEDLPF